MDEVRYLSIQEAAQRLNVHHSTVWRWLKKGTLEGEQVLGRTAIRESVVEQRLAERPVNTTDRN